MRNGENPQGTLREQQSPARILVQKKTLESQVPTAKHPGRPAMRVVRQQIRLNMTGRPIFGGDVLTLTFFVAGDAR
jgi:hypothetical protein